MISSGWRAAIRHRANLAFRGRLSRDASHFGPYCLLRTRQGPYEPHCGPAKDHNMNRRLLLLNAGAMAVLFTPALVSVAWCANAAEDFVSGNIQAGFDILNDRNISPAERRERFASFVLGLTDVKRVALFLLGRYAADAPQADLDAYISAYQHSVLSTYNSYFSLYAGQSLRVIASRQRAPDDFVVTTNTVGAKPVLVDLGVAGVWLGLAQRDQFLAVLAQNNGDIKALTAHLRAAQTR